MRKGTKPKVVDRQEFLAIVNNAKGSEEDSPLAHEVEPMIQWLKAKQQARGAIAHGDIDPYRSWIELFKRTGIPVHVLMAMPERQVRGLLQAAARMEQSTTDEVDFDPWVVVAVGDMTPNRSTIGRHADDDSKPEIRKYSRGFYELRESVLPIYLSPKMVEKYRRAK